MSDFTLLWRDLTVGLTLPDRAFGAAVDVDGLLVEPELHFAATPSSSRLLLMPSTSVFARLMLEWETLPEIGTFTASALPSAGSPGSSSSAPYDPDELARLETWMRDVAVVLHAHRDRIREASERVVRDAARGRDRSLPSDVDATAHVVSAHIGTRVTGPSDKRGFGVVDVTGPHLIAGDPTLDEVVFVEESHRVLGRRVTSRRGDEVVDVLYRPEGAGVETSDLVAWYDQHIFREILFDDVWQVYVHLIAGLDAPSNVEYFGA